MRATSRYHTGEEAQAALSNYRSYLERAETEDQRTLWGEKVAGLEKWLSSEEFRTGEYPQGLDELVLDLVDWRSMIFSFQNVDLQDQRFTSSRVFAQWQSGAAYAVACILGKLVSRDARDNSLVNVWEQVAPFMIKDHCCTQEEADEIARQLQRRVGYFTNQNSKAMLLRNKMIAHNESSPRVVWEDLDRDIEILARIWALLVGFCSFGILFPFPSPEKAFDGLSGAISPIEIRSLQKCRAEFLQRFKIWTQTNLATAELDSRPRAFAEISFSARKAGTP